MIGSANVPWYKKYSWSRKNFLENYRWIYAPGWSAFIFALRTTIASFLALAIALWLELDSPKWAPMTVWVCARNTSRGETISKAYWRGVGTVFGAIAAVVFVAVFPQQPWLFNITVASFVALCVWCGTCMQSFKAYAMVLSGYTCAIIAFSSINDPHGTFMMAMARTTYILLGVWCDSFVGRFFDVNIDKNARTQLNNNLKFAICETIQSVVNMLSKDEKMVLHSQELLTSVISFDNSIEFRQIEMNGNDHTGDHAHAALFSVTAVLARSMGLSIRMQHFKNVTADFASIIPNVQECLKRILDSIENDHDFNLDQSYLNKLRWECRQHITDSFYKKIDTETPDKGAKQREIVFNDRILFRKLSELLGEIEVTLEEYHKSSHPIKNDHFKFHVSAPLNFDLAWKNGLRTFVAMISASLMWYMTGWNMGGTMVSLTGMGCARFCLFENPAQVTFGWFKGTFWALLAGSILTLYLIPPLGNFESLCMALFIPTMLGGLGIANLKTLPVSASYAAYLPYMLQLDNQVRLNESTFFNNSLALLMGIFFAIASFRIIYPYSPLKTRLHLRQMLLKKMHALASVSFYKRSPRIWLFQTAALLVNMVRQLSGESNTKLIHAYSQGTVAVMMIGLNILRLHSMIDHDVVTEDIKILLRIVLRRISKYSGKYGRTVAVCHAVVKRLREREKSEKNLALRMEIIAAVSCLTVIADSLDKNKAFLDVTHPFLLKEDSVI
ncbi:MULTISPECIES: FUSC family protein [Commensalibacter]|uniref:FUSC family protein n=1 Tax=Commensalibacter TaxID=1079922 RepID=UPI0012D96B76|nr:FUSC family protein [Commensalibacter melissae]MBI0017081.1 FUSC family protein [Commensalibacter sp. B14384M2]MBI0018826.1 FUSC family protein [Commensalibacter sp. W8133]MBI0050266.1 FUSC family protein [Commensalibacter sp. B14384M3]MBI0083137.1 FUSC family protein [Commensalibacter sp. W6292M3]MBI0178976.1 FUSC family protein [Commensalibacter sp. W8163]